jgi:hypothetical protein
MLQIFRNQLSFHLGTDFLRIVARKNFGIRDRVFASLKVLKANLLPENILLYFSARKQFGIPPELGKTRGVDKKPLSAR